MLELVKLKNMRIKNRCWIFVVLLVFLVLLITFIPVFDSCKTIGIYNEEEKKLTFTLPYDQVKLLNGQPLLSYDHDFLSYKNLTFLEIHSDDYTVYQDFSVEVELEETKVMDLKILNRKQRLIKKILKAMKEG